MRQDVIRRILQDYFGLNLIFVLGITDIDDKVIRRSQEVTAMCL